MISRSFRSLDATEVYSRILARDEQEIAVLDVRPGGTFGEGHLLWANSTPLSTLECDVLDRVPRKSTPIILCAADSADDELIDRAARKLDAFGYKDICYLSGGVAAWGAVGYEVFSGVNVPSKAFGEFVEHTYDTPRIPPESLKKMMDEGADFVVLDSRPMSEFNTMNIPHGVDVPGAELVLRVHDIAPNPETTVVVNCAGRTRSIIGCQSLKNAEIPNPVYALENGTMGWHLAGFELEYGNERKYGSTSATARRLAQTRAEAVRRRFNVPVIDAETLGDWRQDTTRTTFVFDVRDSDEFTESHIPGSRPAPGGQLVQATDRYVGTLGARIVCVDDDGVRASMTASWLSQIGWDACVLAPNTVEMSEYGAYAPTLPPIPEVPLIEAVPLAARMIQTHVIDIGDSLTHRRSHIPGSRFAIRANLPSNLASLSDDRPIVIASDDGVMARFAVADLLEDRSDREIFALDGGAAAWAAAGLPMKGGFDGNLDRAVDVWYRPYDMDDAQEGAMKQYLSWEVNLVQQVSRDGTTNFRAFN